MTRERPTTLSDTPFERRVYEQSGKNEIAFMLDQLHEILGRMPAPKGWRRKRGPGRPRNRYPGGQEKYSWQSMMIVLILRAYFGMTTREMSSFLSADPWLCERLALPKPPSHTSIARAVHRYPEAWLKKLNRELIGDVKKRGPDGRVIELSAWIRQGFPSKESEVGKRFASTRAPSVATIANWACSSKPDRRSRNSCTSGDLTRVESPT